MKKMEGKGATQTEKGGGGGVQRARESGEEKAFRQA